MLPHAVTDAVIEGELPGAIAWANRHQIALDTRLIPQRILRAVLMQEDGGEKFYLQGNFDDYKELPPIWDWRDQNWSNSGQPTLSPDLQDSPFGGSMFIRHSDQGIICAPFNRLAYGTNDGPHSEWGSPAQWMTTGQEYVYAVTIGDMLQSILRDFRLTKGRMQ